MGFDAGYSVSFPVIAPIVPAATAQRTGCVRIDPRGMARTVPPDHSLRPASLAHAEHC